MSTVKKYLSLIKFSHTIFAMPFAMIGFFLAIRMLDFAISLVPGWHTTILSPAAEEIYRFNNIPFTTTEKIVRLVQVVLCMVFARSAAMAFNRYLDRRFDAQNPRTAIREIPAGILKADNVLLFTIVCGLLLVHQLAVFSVIAGCFIRDLIL